MLRQRFLLGVLAAGLAGLPAPRPAAAQYPVGDRPSEMTVGRSSTESYGPGYTFYTPSATFAGRYDFYPGQYTGSVPSQPLRDLQRLLFDDVVRLLAHHADLAQLPGGVRLLRPGAGGVCQGDAGLPHPAGQPASDNPVGAPTPRSGRRLDEVPRRGQVELTARAERRP